MAEPVPMGFVRLRCANPRDHWEWRVGIGHQEVVHEADHTIVVPVGHHAQALLKAGYVIDQ
jgi:hypothetical protein